MGFLILYFFLVIAISFLCSLLESTILSVKDSYIRYLKSKSKKSGTLLFELKDEIDRPLAAILTLNTVANTLGASIIGAHVLKTYGNEMVAIVSGILTLFILVFSEIIPKTIGALFWKTLAIPSAFIIQYLIYVLYPMVWLFEHLSDWISLGKKKTPIFTREELIATAEISQEEGTIRDEERNIIKNLLKLNRIYVKDIMTPRSVIIALSQNLSIDTTFEKYGQIPFSRIPIYEKDLNNITGMVLRYEVLDIYGKDEGDKKYLRDISNKIEYVSDEKSVGSIMSMFIKKQSHIFIAKNALSETTGLVTLEDVIETLLGVEIVDEFDNVEDMRAFAVEQSKKRIRGRRTSRVVSKLLEELNN